jgi:hypothetical protein
MRNGGALLLLLLFAALNGHGQPHVLLLLLLRWGLLQCGAYGRGGGGE